MAEHSSYPCFSHQASTRGIKKTVRWLPRTRDTYYIRSTHYSVFKRLLILYVYHTPDVYTTSQRFTKYLAVQASPRPSLTVGGTCRTHMQEGELCVVCSCLDEFRTNMLGERTTPFVHFRSALGPERSVLPCNSGRTRNFLLLLLSSMPRSEQGLPATIGAQSPREPTEIDL